ncbi:Hypothetical protein EHI5A_124660 [Entamoeba histolytica KU27]|uniref:Uncharacterized protein n=1 Tax=Entamoeba histolytica KU27 TaxID=885311 RepID=M2RWJ2_ENTHI|nr:Hypothetical protein EHI5A_124660 [Entamoeba histolytica KU27]
MNDPIHKIPDDNKINAMIDMIREGNFKTMLRDVDRQLKKKPNNQFWKAMKAYGLAYTGQLEKADEINNSLIKEDVITPITMNWILYGYRASKNIDGYVQAVKIFYKKDKNNDDRIKDRFFIAQIENDYSLQQTLISELIKKHPNKEKYIELRMYLLASNPKTRIMAKMMLTRSHQKKGEVMILLDILQKEKNYKEMIKLLEESISSGMFCRFEQRENYLVIMELLEKSEQYELIPNKVISYLDEFKDEDYSAYTYLLHSLKYLKEEDRKKYLELINKRKEMKFSSTMRRSVFIFLIEYQLQFGTKENVQQEILNYLKEFSQLRLCASDIIPKLNNETALSMIDITKDYPLFNAQLKLKCCLELTEEDIKKIQGETVEKNIVEICNLIQNYQREHNRNSLFKAINICEDELKKNEDEHEFHMLEVQCYLMLGMREDAVEEIMHQRMDIKDVLLESLGHHIFPIFYSLGINDKYETIIKKYYNFHKDHAIYMKDNVTQAIDSMNWEELNDLFKFEEELKKSSTKAGVNIFEVLRQLQDSLIHSFENNKFIHEKCINKIQKIIEMYQPIGTELIDNCDRHAYFCETFYTLPHLQLVSPFYDIERNNQQYQQLYSLNQILLLLQQSKKPYQFKDFNIEGELNQMVIKVMNCIVQEKVEEGNELLESICKWINTQFNTLTEEEYLLIRRNLLLTVETIGLTFFLIKKNNSFNKNLINLLNELKKEKSVNITEQSSEIEKKFVSKYSSYNKEVSLIVERFKKIN